jgi:hypothetical protein
MVKIKFLFISATKMKVIHLLKLTIMVFFLIFSTAPYTHAENNKDSRILVKVPEDIKEKTKKFMRGHLRALEDTIHAIQSDDYNKAEHIIESRLNMGSPESIEGHEVVKHWPEPMQDMANQLYLAASNYVIISKSAATKDSKISEEDVIAALGKVVTNCRGCHETYRLR